jgi:MFS transporter
VFLAAEPGKHGFRRPSLPATITIRYGLFTRQGDLGTLERRHQSAAACAGLARTGTVGKVTAGHKASFRDAFTSTEFRALWTAQALSLIGDQFARVAIAILVYSRTQSPFLTALVYSLTYLPPIVAGPHLSALADLFPRRRVMICCDILRAAFVAVMALPEMPVWAIGVLLTATTLAGVPFAAGRAAMLPAVLPGDRLAAGQAVSMMTDHLSQVMGFVTGAVVVTAVGVHVTLFLDALSFVFSALLLARWVRARPVPEWKAGARRSAGAGARRGISLVTRDRVALLLVLFGWLAGFYAVPEALAAPYAHALGQGPAAVGLLMAAMPAGVVLGAATLTRLVPPSRRLRTVGWLAVAATAPLAGSFLHPPLPAVLALWVVTGFASGYQVFAVVAFMQRIPDSGRAAAIGVAASGLLAVQGIGFLAGGALAGMVGPEAAVAWAGAAGLAAAIMLWAFWSQTRHAVSGQPPQDRAADAAPANRP